MPAAAAISFIDVARKPRREKSSAAVASTRSRWASARLGTASRHGTSFQAVPGIACRHPTRPIVDRPVGRVKEQRRELGTERRARGLPRDLSRVHRSGGAPARRAAERDRARSRTSSGSRSGAAGLLGLVTPEEHGGGGGDALAVALLSEELARASGGIAVTLLVSAYMAGPHLARRGTPAQQDRWCQALADGEAVAAIAVTEPGTGSDVAGMRTTARRTGRRLGDQRPKMFITNAGAGRRDHRRRPHRRPPATAASRCSSSRRARPACPSATRCRKMGWHSSDTREVVLDGVQVGADAVLGDRGPRLPADHGGLPARADLAGRDGPRARGRIPRPGKEIRRASARPSVPRSRTCRPSATGSRRWTSSSRRRG